MTIGGRRTQQVNLAYLVFFTPRSGSYLLCDRLEASGVAGRPAECFGPVKGNSAGEADSAVRQLATSVACACTPNDVFGAKVTRFHFGQFSERLASEVGDPDIDLADALSVLAADLRFVWIRRHDRARQAVSYWRALATGEWALISGATPTSIDPSAFDVGEVRRLESRIASDETWIETYLRERRTSAFVVWYEDLEADPDGIADDVLNSMGLTRTRGSMRRPRLSRQADSVSEELVERYLGVTPGASTKPGPDRREPCRPD